MFFFIFFSVLYMFLFCINICIGRVESTSTRIFSFQLANFNLPIGYLARIFRLTFPNYLACFSESFGLPLRIFWLV